MVDLVNVLVEKSPVESTMRPVVPGVLHDEENGNLECHLGPCREGNTGVHAEVFAHGVEEPDLRKLDSEVGEENHLGTSPLLFSGWDFLLQIC